jgi:L-ascorbate metabolism protein UlaG (beta-lactamase superfamily)
MSSSRPDGRLTYVGHATVLIEQDGTRLLTDPLLRPGIAHVRRRVPLPDLEDLRDLDAVLISHAHADHLDVPSLRLLAHGGPVVAPRGSAGILRKAGLRDVIEMVPGDRCTVGSAELEAVPAAHDGKRQPLGSDMPALGFLVSGPARVYFAGDTDLFDGMRDLADGLDGALLPISGWGRHVPAGHLTPERAAVALEMLRPRWAIPVHWGTYAGPGGRHVLTDPARAAREFARWAAEIAPGVEILVPEPGVPTRVPPRAPAASS